MELLQDLELNVDERDSKNSERWAMVAQIAAAACWPRIAAAVAAAYWMQNCAGW